MRPGLEETLGSAAADGAGLAATLSVLFLVVVMSILFFSIKVGRAALAKGV